ncbi:MAG: hypothetical protein EGQ45_01350 [Clostridiales bacterium]|jgi:hypothetical protein|nr:hypothetical protein [Clostridiales bacterium]
MNDLKKACEIAIAKQKQAYGVKTKAIRISKIGETNDLYIISFYPASGSVECGGGGLIVYKKDFSVDHYCIPSYPKNIFEIIDSAVDIDVPREYA